MEDRIKKMLELEPKLVSIATYVAIRNEIAKTKRIYWYEVWKESKLLGNRLVGFMAENEELKNRESYDLFHAYLKSLATNCI